MSTAALVVVLLLVPSLSLAIEPELRDIEYARVDDHSLRLDLYQPNHAVDRVPLIVWVHGGAWRRGSKDDVPITYLLDHGFAIASVDYRLSPVAPFPAQVHDINAAIRFLRAHANEYGLDPDRFIVAGSSAGGHLAALIGVSNGVAELEGNVGEDRLVSSDVQAAVSFYGASNLQTILGQSTEHGLSVRIPALKLLLGGLPDQQSSLARLASPVMHVDRADPPLWLIHGDADPQMPIEQSYELEAALQQANVPVDFQVIAGGKHGGEIFYTDERLRGLSRQLHERIGSVAVKSAKQPTLSWKRHATDLPEAIWAVEAVDTEADGSLELIAVGAAKVWALSSPTWQPTLIAETPGGRTIHAVAVDFNGDGDDDLALGRPSSDWIAYREGIAAGKLLDRPAGEDWTVAWLENPSRGGQPWPLHPLDRELHGVHGVAVGDVNQDGQPDLIADSFAGPHLESSLAWFEAGMAAQRSPRRMITDGGATGRPHYMDFADIDGDGRGDVLLGASTEGSFTWWQQPEQLDQSWARNVIAWEPGATHPYAVDVSGDGLLDVIGSAGHGVGVAWYEAPDWKKRVIDNTIRDVHAFAVSDLDGDGDIDAAGCSFSQQIVRWWENLGQGVFASHDLDTEHQQQAYDLKVADLNDDGRPDILLAGRGSENVVWYENLAEESE